MSGYGGGIRQESEPYALNAGRFWASSIATAVVAALLTVVGVLVTRGLFDVAILAPRSHGVWGGAPTVTYAAGAAVVALLAAGLMHLLILTVAEPRRFFGWIMALATLIAVIMPLTLADRSGPRIATAVINLAIGIAVATIVDGVAQATRQTPGTHPSRGEVNTTDRSTRV
ncbi:hypothetical protein Asp14428_74110 [Actinoplanes sp. NBRC 14428]|uniref:Uncharacterized protein n=2 Tax=Pseudosporangium ferrugineum TaxID=439699 RepID=A0A2T0RJK8_9ACTN|nr:hypothetical protein CLV70_12011 [Pseudosporangium ferrugineum]BCJ55936.1 hypothetical protein Asp14428_74110 [Actinoplanes sp. NBRC 14428]